MTIHFQDARQAINAAAGFAPCCVGYRKGEGWFIYSPLDGCATDAEPEFFIARPGTHPIPLTETASEVWVSCLSSLR